MDFELLLDKGFNFAIYWLSVLVLIGVGKAFFWIVFSKINIRYELVENDNLAFSIMYASYFASLIIAISGLLLTPAKDDLLSDLIDMAGYGILTIILLNISYFVNQHLILYKFDTIKEIITDKNPGTALVLAASFLSTGLVIGASVSGEGGGYHTALIFWITGQVILIIFSKIYNFITPFDVHDEIEKDNVAAGFSFAGFLLAVAIIINSAFYGDFLGWYEALTLVLLDIVIALLILPLARYVIDKIFLPGRKLSDEIANQEIPNTGAGLIEATGYILAALITVWCL